MDNFGCIFCAGVGYEDYPLNRKPCRMQGHSERHEQNVKEISMWMKLHPLPEPLTGKPKGNWEWTGRGWNNLDYKNK